MIALAFIVAAVAFMIWRTHEYLKGPRIGKRSSLSMSVRDNRIHFRGRK